ncbi:unnamed protein product [Lampetra fluviatilis]
MATPCGDDSKDKKFQTSHATCSFFGAGSVRTFDGELFSAQRLCPLTLAQDCEGLYFGVEVAVRDANRAGDVTVRLAQDTVTFHPSESEGGEGVSLNGKRVESPFEGEGFVVKGSGAFKSLTAKTIGLDVAWGEDAVTIQVTKKFAKSMCGVCGNYDGNKDLQIDNPGQMKKFLKDSMNNQNECLEYKYHHPSKESQCSSWLEAFGDCVEERSGYSALCEQSKAAEGGDGGGGHSGGHVAGHGACGSLAEYARQCGRHGGGGGQGALRGWRAQVGCAAPSCPEGEEFHDCGSPCEKSCSNPSGAISCDEACVPGCFCPEGTVRDDHGDSHRCISQAVCPCKYEEQLHHAGDSLEDGFNAWGGQWLCDAREQQAECSLEGGSHVTSFDSAAFSFHSEGDFILCMEEEEELPSLAAILFTSTSEKLEIDSEGKMFLNDLPLPLPYHSGSPS